jgi:hypothetical protein
MNEYRDVYDGSPDQKCYADDVLCPFAELLFSHNAAKTLVFRVVTTKSIPI